MFVPTIRRYQIIVGNVGTVYDGNSKSEAQQVWSKYLQLSRYSVNSRAYKEDVTFMTDGEPGCGN